MAVHLITVDAVKAHLPIRAGNTDFDDKIRSYIATATSQIQRATRREFDKKVRVEYHNTRGASRSVVDLFGTDDLSVDTFHNMGLATAVREQIITLKALPIDEAATIEVRYDPIREFGDGTIVDPENYEVDPEKGRLFLRYGTARTIRGLQITYTAGITAQQLYDLIAHNALDPNAKGADVALSNSNLTATVTPAVKVGSVVSLYHHNANKFFMEFVTGTENGRIGLAAEGFDTAQGVGETADSWGLNLADGQIYNGGAGAAYGDHVHNGDVVGMALDMDAGAVWFSRQGIWMNGATEAEIVAGDTTHAAVSGLTGNLHVGVGDADIGETFSATANFGATPFLGPIPSGYVEGSGPVVFSKDSVLVDPPDELALAATIQTVFLWKKFDTENVGAKTDKKQGGPNIDFLKAAGLTPEAASLLTDYKTIVKGTS